MKEPAMRSAFLKAVPLALACCVVLGLMSTDVVAQQFRCGAAKVDVTPRHLPVIRNGGFLQAEDHKIVDRMALRSLLTDLLVSR